MELRRLNLDLKQSMIEVKTLMGLLSILAGCKKIKEEDGSWRELESYISNHNDATSTHCLCTE